MSAIRQIQITAFGQSISGLTLPIGESIDWIFDCEYPDSRTAINITAANNDLTMSMCALDPRGLPFFPPVVQHSATIPGSPVNRGLISWDPTDTIINGIPFSSGAYAIDLWLTDPLNNRLNLLTGTVRLTYALTLPGDNMPGPPGASIVWRGLYNPGTTYAPLDAVSFGSPAAMYICTAPTTNHDPTNASYWDLACDHGAAGTAGTTLPSQSGQAGKFLETDGTNLSWAAAGGGSSLPSQSGQGGKVLGTDGSSASWVADQVTPLSSSTPAALGTAAAGSSSSASRGDHVHQAELPSQSGQNGKVLGTNGTTPSWVADQTVALSTLNPLAAGVAAPGSASTASKYDHVHPTSIPAQAGHSGEFLTTNGSAVAWAATGGSVDFNLPYVLKYPENDSEAHIYIGRFFEAGKVLSWKFFYDMWICPKDDGSAYYLIESQSAAHVIEIGFSQGGAGTINRPSGYINISTNGGTTIYVISDEDGLYNDEWGHIAMHGDGTHLFIHINGICVMSVANTGSRQTAVAETGATGALFIGCSDHNCPHGKVGGYVRGFEDFNPFSAYGNNSTPIRAFFPERFAVPISSNGLGQYRPCNLLINLNSPGNGQFEDHSGIGFNGLTSLATPAAPSLSVVGTSGATTRGYVVVAMLGGNSTDASAETTNATTNATLTTSNYVSITWTPDPRADGYRIFCTTGPRKGLLATLPAGTSNFHDDGVATPASVRVPDMNLTSGGPKHSGMLFASQAGPGGLDEGPPAGGIPYYPTMTWLADPTAPFTKSGAPAAQGKYPITPSVLPVNIRIFDDFEKADSTYAFQNAPSLGSTVAGASRGALAWTTSKVQLGIPAAWGVFHGRARFLDASKSVAYVDNGQANMDVQVDIYSGTNHDVNHAQGGVVARLVDGNNFWVCFLFGNPGATTMRLESYVAGAETDGGDTGLPGGVYPERLRVTCVGNVVTGYTGVWSGAYDANGFKTYTWTQRAQYTSTTHNTATKCGLGMMSDSGSLRVNSLSWYDNFSCL